MGSQKERWKTKEEEGEEGEEEEEEEEEKGELFRMRTEIQWMGSNTTFSTCGKEGLFPLSVSSEQKACFCARESGFSSAPKRKKRWKDGKKDRWRRKSCLSFPWNPRKLSGVIPSFPFEI
jgi:hypothetical protein